MADLPSGPIESPAAAASLLENGESVLWSGRPKQGLIFRANDTLMIPFSLLWCGLAIHWETLAIAKDAPLFFTAWGGFFVMAGLYVLFGRFVGDALHRHRLVYVVTDQRLLLITEARRRRVKIVELATLSEIELAEGRDGRGTLTFGRDLGGLLGWGRTFRGWPGSTQYVAPAFERIEHAADVLRLIRAAQRRLVRAPRSE